MADKKNTMTKDDLAEQLATEGRMLKNDANKAVDIVFKTIAEGLIDSDLGSVKIAGFGSFELVKRPAREGVNPADPTKKITIPASNAVKFKPSKTLKDVVNGKK